MSDYSPEERISRKPSSEEPERKSRKGIIIAVICIVVVIAAVVALVILLKPNKPKTETDDQKRSEVVTPDNIDQILADVEGDKLTPSSYEVVMNTTWMFENGQSASSNAYVENSVYNSNPVYFDVVRSDTGDTIYSSPIIPVGSHLANIALDKDLSAGTYPCQVTYYLVDEDQNPLSTVVVNLTIIIDE